MNAVYISSIQIRRPSNMAPILFVHATRFDLVSPTHIETEGFRSSFLLRTKTPISKVESFFKSDPSRNCNGLCRWEFRRLGGQEQTAMGIDRAIDAAGPGPTHEEVVYYVSLRNLPKKTFAPLAAVADMTNPAYREWRVRRAKLALQEGGYDAVTLNQKFSQYYKDKGYWLGSSWCPDISNCTGKPDTIFSARPDGYGFAEYVAGWVALAHDLQSAEVPYVVRLIPHPWLTVADDPSTPEIDEASQIRSVLKGARLVMLDSGNTGPDFSITEWAEQLRLSGVSVLLVDKRCGYAKKAMSR